MLTPTPEPRQRDVGNASPVLGLSLAIVVTMLIAAIVSGVHRTKQVGGPQAELPHSDHGH